MKWMIASDLHGSALYTRQLVEAYRREKAEKLLLLGDILYHGPRNDLPEGYAPKEVIALLNPLKDEILCVQGNCDAEVDQMVLDFTISPKPLVIEEGDVTLFVTHGHHENPANPPQMEGPYVLLHGHTHVPAYQPYEGFVYVNPGSVSIPKENSPHSYITLENGVLQWKNLSGDVYREETIQL